MGKKYQKKLIIKSALISILCISGFVKAQLPQVYDLRVQNLMSPVKDQGSCGACWAFAAVASIESNWLKKGFGLQILSEDNIIDCHGFDEGACEGGSYYMVNALFSKHKGPLLSSVDPYTPTVGDCANNQTFPPVPPAYAEEIRFLPKNTALIKQALYDNGALATAMFFNMAHYNTNTYKYYDNLLDANDSLYPHCVAIAGWNDTMLFTGAPAPGGWIIKDSYGTSWAQNGYFYVSYYDVGILSETVYFPSREEVPTTPLHSNVYLYDDFGWVDNFGLGTQTAYAMAQYTIIPMGGSIPMGQQIKYIGTYAVNDNMTITIDIYSHYAGGVLSGLMASSNITCPYKGFYTLPFSLPTDTLGTVVYIKAKYTSLTSTNVIPVEKYEANHTSGISLSANSNYISTDGNTWQLTGQGSSYNFDVCIKMFTEEAPKAKIFCVADSVCQEQMAHFTDETPMPKDSVRWFLNNVYQSTMPMLDIIMSSAGLQEIKLIAYYGGNSDTAIKNIQVNSLPALPVIVQSGDTLFSPPANNYQWYDDNGMINGAVLPYFVPLVSGNYYVHVFNQYQCEAVSNAYNFLFTSVSDITHDNILIFPNPFEHSLNIVLKEQSEIKKLIVCDLFGKIILSAEGPFEQNILLELPEGCKGVYILKLVTQDAIFKAKIFAK